MQNFKSIIFIWVRTYREIFKSALVYLNDYCNLKTIYHNGSYLLLFEKRNYKVFNFVFQIIPLALKEAPLLSTARQQAPHPKAKASKLNKRRGGAGLIRGNTVTHFRKALNSKISFNPSTTNVPHHIETNQLI